MIPLRDAISEHLKHVEFNGVVVLTIDLKSGQMRNWWRFDGHPDCWTTKDLSTLAQSMTAAASEELKKEANTGDRQVDVQQPRVVRKNFGSDEHFTNLFALGFAKPHNPKVRVWFSAWFCWAKCGLALGWVRGVWLLIGPLEIGVTIEAARGL